jgi:hypothetical protein
MSPMPADSTGSPTRQLADLKLGGRLDAFVMERRGATPRKSWRKISQELFVATGIDVTHETLRGWYQGQPLTAAAAR